MKCLICGGWNLTSLICKPCFPSLSLGTRLVDEMSVYSFYAFSDIELLMHYKYTPVGSRIFASLAREARRHFAQNVKIPKGVIGVGIDDVARKGYSHTGVILHEFSQCGIKPIYGELKASNEITYAGKSLDYRQSNPKGFQSKLKNQDIIIFDDVITTGTSLKEAKKLLETQENRVLFALTLCDARR